MNFLTLDGRVGKNGAEIKTSKGGKQYLKFTLANNSFSGGQNKTTWFDVVCYKPELINGIGQYLKKGSFVNVRGPMEVTHNVDQNNKVWINVIVTADLIEFPQVGGKRDDEGNYVYHPTTDYWQKLFGRPTQDWLLLILTRLKNLF